MSLDTYSHLQTTIQSFLFGRTDLAAIIPDWIRLAEAQMNRRLDCRQMQEVATFTITGETRTVPEGFAGVKTFRLQTNPVTPLKYVEPDAFDDAYDAGGQTSAPYYYTIIGDKFVFSPAISVSAGSAARLRYRKRVEPLSSANFTNWVLEQHPDAYLYGALMQSAPWLVEDERLSTWSGLFLSAIEDINADDVRQSYGSSLQTRSGIADG